jgi:hypothetical protein
LEPQANGDWKETILYEFPPSEKSGAYPFSGVIFDSAGNLYGATLNGGSVGTSGSGYAGTVFEVTP